MFQKYASYQTADFVADADFIEWVRRPTPLSNQFWQEFLEVFPHQQPALQQARQTVRLLTEEGRAISADPNDAKQIWEAIEESLDTAPIRRIGFLPNGWQRWAAAAAVVLTLGAGWYFIGSPSSGRPETYQALVEEAEAIQPLEEVINTTTQPQLVSLPDGSTITLEKDSRVSFAKSFEGTNREVYLTGAAFFDVTKNPDKPFLVYSNELVTKVLGTSFRIQAFEKDKNIVVSVKTGRVSVYPKKSPESADPETAGMLLTPNQEVKFARAEERFNRTLIEKPTVLLTQEELQQYAFDDAPVSRIFAALEKAYGVEIVFDEEVMANCHLTTSLSAETLFDKLAVICEGIGATYKIVDAQVVVSGRGCN
ncbi:FecR family protein [Persicitalea sp.]|uniref:FecR family protein n=1 Tax=Persicitalea sp. TaxID=3100273 RepID=UPI0035933900